ncbi:MAG: hypothetical protein COW03_07850 [Cytophagales bacterium CG12_big_fil_rev_8_21_14_0_65_40_12]|nr:MAG: hypothetical protein COW03_07850 [Cytophagales bacterium CG12_big_fil_rev_8_21_14_0_65_40_12]PIW05750.1 MAG: hypothetical protein COW40_03130 [Cytophagales bacterium CG17_big_fil_post_rev_8_21_14_2_50_40_13]
MARMKNLRTKNQNNKVMKSSKVRTQKNLSAVIALALALVTLFQASFVSSNETSDNNVTIMEAELVAEIEMMLSENEDTSIIDEVYMEIENENIATVKVFDTNNELIAEGNPSENEEVRKLVNQADFLLQSTEARYFRIG